MFIGRLISMVILSMSADGPNILSSFKLLMLMNFLFRYANSNVTEVQKDVLSADTQGKRDNMSFPFSIQRSELSLPENRYGHVAVTWDNAIIIWGGAVNTHGYEVPTSLVDHHLSGKWTISNTMDINKILKEIDQRTTRYEMNKGSLQGVLDYNPELDLEAGMKEEENRTTNTCVKSDIAGFICITPIILGVFILAGYTLYQMLKGFWEEDF